MLSFELSKHVKAKDSKLKTDSDSSDIWRNFKSARDLIFPDAVSARKAAFAVFRVALIIAFERQVEDFSILARKGNQL